MLGNFTYHNPTKLIFGADESMLEGLADSTLIMQGGYHALTRDEAIEVFRASL